MSTTIEKQAASLVEAALKNARLEEMVLVKTGEPVYHRKFGKGRVKYLIHGDEGARIELSKGGTKEVKFADDPDPLKSSKGWRRYGEKSRYAKKSAKAFASKKKK
jgi:hypothetical protein